MHVSSLIKKEDVPHKINSQKLVYVLDADSNLPETEKRMSKFFEDYQDWTGYKKEIPPFFAILDRLKEGYIYV